MAKGETKTSPKQSCSTLTIIFIYLAGFGIRYWLIFSKYQAVIGNHIEVSTPLNSWKRVLEGLYLQSQGVNPYEGDLLHETPIIMVLYKTLTQLLSAEMIFLIVDMCTAILSYFIARRYVFQLFVQQEKHIGEYLEDSKEMLLSGSDFVNAPVYTAAAFLFNPYLILNCVGLSTTVFHNFFLTIFLCSMLYGSVVMSTLALAVCAMMSLYPVVLIVPLCLYFSLILRSKTSTLSSFLLFIVTITFLLHISRTISNGNAFMKNVYGFVLTVPDLQPNIGLFWYFFTEMFDHFRELFMCSFQINATILYLVPLSIRFRKDPFLLSFALLFLIAIFKSYPCLGDIGFALSLIPCFVHLYSYSQQGFLVSVIILITTALGPILWYLWIYTNSANANFYFGVTLAFAIALIFLVTDLLFSHLKREFSLIYGKKRKIGEEDAMLILE